MNVTLRMPRMTREQFLDWVERQDEPFEFDGDAPVAMTGGTRRHARLCSNILYELRKRLEGSAVEVLPEAGIATIGGAIRYPDILLTATPGPASDRLMPEPLIVVEVVSPTSGRVDRTLKLREYRSLASIRRYVIVDSSGPDIAVFFRTLGATDWIADALTTGDSLVLPEIGIEVPVDDVFRGVTFAEE